jgi:hypothetical protein
MKISYLHPHGPSASYIYPATPHILWLPQSAIPNTATGRTYTLTSEETKLTAERSKTHLQLPLARMKKKKKTLHFSCK